MVRRGRQAWKIYAREMTELKTRLAQTEQKVTNATTLVREEVDQLASVVTQQANQLVEEKAKLEFDIHKKTQELAATSATLHTVNTQLEESNRCLSAVIRSSQTKEQKLNALVIEHRTNLERLQRAIATVVEDATCAMCMESPQLVVLQCGCAHICKVCYNKLKNKVVGNGSGGGGGGSGGGGQGGEVDCPLCRLGHPIHVEPRFLHAKITNLSLCDSIAVTLKELPHSV